MLEIRQLSTGYDHLLVLREVSALVQSGEFVGLIGPNGAGKTTLLRAVVGICRPWTGQIYLNGKPIGGKATFEIVRMGVSYVPETLNLFVNMSVQENLLMGAYTISSKKELTKNAEFVYKLFPVLKERDRQLAGTLSGGERKMLAIGRALMSSPRLLLVDEPSLGLAPFLVEAVFGALEALHKEGITILLVEQHVETVLRLTSRCYVLEQGQIVLHGPSQELLGDPHLRRAYLGV